MAEQPAESKEEKELGATEASYSVIAFSGQKLPKQYEGLIYKNWLISLRYGNEYFRLIDKESYFKTYDKYISLLLNRPTSIVRIAVLTSDYDVALGWSLSDGDVLHYVYVQKDHAHQGIGSVLIPKDLKYITHLTKNWIYFWGRKYKHVKFNPFI